MSCKASIVEPAQQDSMTAARLVLIEIEAAMNDAKEKPEQRLCQGVSPLDETCDAIARRRCPRCRLWFCRAHFPDPDWHSCAPDQGTS
jgi:hypothetical protein